jgi:hypothetical protein
MILYPLVYGSFPWSAGYDFHPSNKSPDGKTLTLPFDPKSSISKSDLESVLRKCSSEFWFTRQLTNGWFLVGHTYNSLDAHNRPSSVVYSLLVPPYVVDMAGGIPDPQSLVMDWEPVWSGSEEMTKRNIQSRGNYVWQNKEYKKTATQRETYYKKRIRPLWKPTLIVVSGLVLCVGIACYILSGKKPEPTPPATFLKEQVDIHTKHVFEWYIRNFNKLPEQYQTLQKYYVLEGDIDIPEENLPMGNFREHLSNLMTFLLGDGNTPYGLNDEVENIILSLIKEAEENFNQKTIPPPDPKEYKRLYDHYNRIKKQLEMAGDYFESQAALVSFIQGLSHKDGEFEDVLIQEHRKYHVKYIRASTTFDSYKIPARLNNLLKQAQRDKKDKKAEIDELLAEYVGLSGIDQLQSLERTADNILKNYIY